MIFRAKEEVQQFLIEINQTHRVGTIKDKDYKPTEEEMSSFIKSRGSIIPKLKSFRKSQDGKENWRKNRYSMMAGIKKWHASTDGKRFHRALGRYNAMHDYRREPKESFIENRISDVVETLKALSSLRTHLFIELDYYHPLNEQVDLEILMEESHPVIQRIEECLLTCRKIREEDIDFIIRLIEPQSLFHELAEYYNQSIPEVKNAFDAALLSLDPNEIGSYLVALQNTKDKLKKNADCQS